MPTLTFISSHFSRPELKREIAGQGFSVDPGRPAEDAVKY
jgi:hypothetical protein